MITVSIIIPCLNEEKYISRCLLSVVNSDYPMDNVEILVLDGMSTDNTAQIIHKLSKEHTNIRVIPNPGKTAPKAMNIGIKAALGEIIVRLDAHAEYPPNYLSELLKWKEKLGADNIGSVWKTAVLNENPKTIAIQKVLCHPFGVGNGLFRTGVQKPMEVDTVPFGCYDKSVFDEVGLYDERLRRNQDIELNKRLAAKGKKIFLIPTTYCCYYARETLFAIAKNNYQNGKWNLLTVYYTKNFQSLSIRHFVPLAFFLSLTLPVLLSLFWQPFIFVSAFSLFLYLAVLTLVVMKMDRKDTNFFQLMLTFFVLHISYGWGSFTGLFHFYKIFQK